MGISFINQATKLTDKDVQRIAEACNLQLQHDVGPAWNIRQPLEVSTKHDPLSYPFFFVDDIPEAPGALAYHYVQDSGVPAGKIGVNTTLKAGDSVSSAASHEAVELQCDIYCASWSFSDRLRCLVATEACDPVQGDSYTITVGDGTKIQVSNFVTPYYFTGDAGKNPLDHLGKLHRTFDIAKGGYQIRMKGGKVTNVFGEAFPDKLREAKAKSQARTYWRQIEILVAMSQQ